MVEKFKNLDVKFQLKICLLFALSYFSPIVGVLVFIYNFFKHKRKSISVYTFDWWCMCTYPRCCWIYISLNKMKSLDLKWIQAFHSS